MRKIIVLAALIPAGLALWPSASNSASRGPAASPSPGKITSAPSSKAPVRPGMGVTARPGGKGSYTTQGSKGTARQVWSIGRMCRRRCNSELNSCIGDLSKSQSSCFKAFETCIGRCGGVGPAAHPTRQAR